MQGDEFLLSTHTHTHTTRLRLECQRLWALLKLSIVPSTFLPARYICLAPESRQQLVDPPPSASSALSTLALLIIKSKHRLAWGSLDLCNSTMSRRRLLEQLCLLLPLPLPLPLLTCHICISLQQWRNEAECGCLLIPATDNCRLAALMWLGLKMAPR